MLENERMVGGGLKKSSHIVETMLKENIFQTLDKMQELKQDFNHIEFSHLMDYLHMYWEKMIQQRLIGHPLSPDELKKIFPDDELSNDKYPC